MSAITASFPGRRPLSLRPLIAVALVVALVIASIAFYVGTQRRVPPPFGVARNGVVVTTNATGDLVSVDPATEASRTLIAGPNLCCVDVAPDGQRFAFLRIDEASGEPASWGVSNVDGTGLRELDPSAVQFIESFDWAPASDRMLIANARGLVVVDAATGQASQIAVPFTVHRASWLGTTGDILLISRIAETAQNGATLRVYRLPAGSASGPVELKTLTNAIDLPIVSPEGSRFLYVTWRAEEQGAQGQIHVVDLASGDDRIITPQDVSTPADMTTWVNPIWSPDGSRVAAERYTVEYARIALIPAVGGEPTLLGPDFQEFTEGAMIRFSPDGSQLLVTYRYNNATWLLPVSGAEGRTVPWAVTEELDWQRLAP